MWFFVFFCPPLYFVFVKKPVKALVNAIICVLALITFPFVLPPLILAFIAIAHAAMDYGRRERTKFATEQANEIARAMKNQ